MLPCVRSKLLRQPVVSSKVTWSCVLLSGHRNHPKNKRTGLKLLLPGGVLRNHPPPLTSNPGTCSSSTSEGSSQPQTINTRLLGPADVQPSENHHHRAAQSVVMLKLQQQACSQAPALTGSLMHLRPCEGQYDSPDSTRSHVYIPDVNFRAPVFTRDDIDSSSTRWLRSSGSGGS